ncbi:hypothetical protein [Pelosinus sp. sgz500959]|uniref:hypothetical protein n=1 Tax=Pelosinus sp. sgz500959 TaxID=3242472 RepID=UPI0036719416
MSEIVNYSVKIDSEQRDLLQKKIAESEMTAGNFLAAMLTNYEATRSRESLSDIRELNQLKNHLARIEEIYIGLAKSRKDVEEDHTHDMAAVQEELVAVKAKLVDIQTAAKKEVEEITNQMKEISDKSVQDNQKNALELADLKEQKEMAEESQRQAVKIASLTEQTLKQTQERMTELEANATLNRKKAEQAIMELDQKNMELTNAIQEIISLKNQLEKERENTKRSLEDQQRHSELDKQNAILLAQQESLVKRENLQDEIVRLRDQLATERERIAQIILASNPIPDQKKGEQ